MCPLYRISHRAGRALTSCPICHEPVSLERCKTDEDGRAIHEDCYVRKICSNAMTAGLDLRTDPGASS